MSALTDRIARQQMHVILDRWGTSLSGKRTMTPSRAFEIARQVTEATEATVREQVARDIRAQRDRFDRDYLEEAAYDDAARIAEEESPNA